MNSKSSRQGSGAAGAGQYTPVLRSPDGGMRGASVHLDALARESEGKAREQAMEQAAAAAGLR